MNPTAPIAGAEQSQAPYSIPHPAPERLPSLNALKHGLRSSAILLPGDDAAEFERLRRELLQTYLPWTRDEAACVEAMAGHHWRIARCRRWQAHYDAQQDALLTGDPEGVAGHICEPDPHRWMHRSMDCVLQESRLERLLLRTRDKLLELQKLRRNHLIARAAERPEDCPFLEAPERGSAPNVRDAGPVRSAGGSEGATSTESPAVSRSRHGGNGKSGKRNGWTKESREFGPGPDPRGVPGAAGHRVTGPRV